MIDWRSALVAFLIGAAVCGGIWFAVSRSDNSLNVKTKEYHLKQQRIIDSLEINLSALKLKGDSLTIVANKSDSIARDFKDSLRKKFNENEKAKNLNAVNELDDSASFEFFSKWLSEGDSN